MSPSGGDRPISISELRLDLYATAFSRVLGSHA